MRPNLGKGIVPSQCDCMVRTQEPPVPARLALVANETPSRFLQQL